MSPSQIPKKQAAKTSGVANKPVAVKAAPPSMAASSETNVMKKRDPALANATLIGIAIITWVTLKHFVFDFEGSKVPCRNSEAQEVFAIGRSWRSARNGA